MKSLSLIVALFCLAAACAFGQDSSTSMTTSLNKALGMYVFPATSQKADQQAKDEQACYDWAVKESKVDPLNLAKSKPDTVSQGSSGTAVKSAAKGAAAGAAIGAIAGDAGKGAAIGAAAGGMGGVSKKKKAAAQQEADAKKAAADKDQAALDSFKKAYSACLEGKGYTVK